MRMRRADSHFFLSLKLNDLAVVDNDFNGAVSNAFDRFNEHGFHIGTRFMTMDRHVFHRPLRTLHHRMMTCLPLFQYQKNEKFG